MTAHDVATVLRTLAAMRNASGQTFRGQCIGATAIEVEELSDGELAMVGLERETAHV